MENRVELSHRAAQAMHSQAMLQRSVADQFAFVKAVERAGSFAQLEPEWQQLIQAAETEALNT